MALINCPECGRQVSDQAAACPNCAHPLRKPSPSPPVNVAMPPIKQAGGHGLRNGCLGVIVILVVLYIIGSSALKNGAGTTPSTAGSVAVSSSATWQPVAQWSGKGSRTTEPFTIKSDQWRAVIKATSDSGGHNQLCLSAKTLDKGDLGMSECLQADSAATYGRAGVKGTMQMQISGVNDGWSVTVEELR